MDVIEILKQAINNRQSISYEYNKPGKTPGRRIGDPYALYRAHIASGQVNTNLHIVQTEGVSDTTDKQPLPSFRTHSVEWLSNVQILEDRPPFDPDHHDYNPNSDMYHDVIAKV